MDNGITQEILKEVLHYDHETGDFTWKERPLSMFKTKRACSIWNKVWANKKAGSIKKSNKSGYLLSISIIGTSYPAHVLAWLYVYGKLPCEEMDALDGNFLNLKIKNLREATRSDNIHKSSSKKRLLPVGVYLDGRANLTKRYFVKIMDNKKSIFIGRYETPEDAHQAYIEAKRRVSPEFCML